VITASGPRVRSARPSDAAALAAVHVACWRETYAHLLSAAFLAAIDTGEKARMWRRALERGPGRVHVAEADGEVVGLVAVRAGGPEAPRELELALLYLRAAHHGSGLGQALLDAAVGARPAFVWVAEDNPRARAFYLRNGFRPDSARQVVEQWEDMAEVRLVR
jgi:ribosomal protein S18 acetylase RimI-like enzyme